MRITYRSHGGSLDYWDLRWTRAAVDDGGLNLDRYPGKYANEIASRTEGPLLEAGCGLGRNVIHFHRLGRDITGVDFVETAIRKIKERHPSVNVRQADIKNLPFPDGAFAGVMAFGLYHSLESGVDKALAETMRVMKPGALLAASVRADRLEDRKYQTSSTSHFHKANYTEQDLRQVLTAAGFQVERIDYFENMPLFYKFRFFRHRTHKEFDETRGRSEGYRLSWLGNLLQRTLVRWFPRSFCNIMVAVARRPA